MGHADRRRREEGARAPPRPRRRVGPRHRRVAAGSDRRRGAEPDHGHGRDARSQQTPSPTTASSSSRRHRPRSRSATSCGSRVPARTTSAPAAGSGFGLAAAVGVQIAQPDRPVVCVIGEGSAQYAITALWTAAAYDVPMTVLVLRNSEYAILKWFAMVEQVEKAPGLDLPALDTAAIAAGIRLSTGEGRGRGRVDRSAQDRDRVAESRACRSGRSRPGMWLF